MISSGTVASASHHAGLSFFVLLLALVNTPCLAQQAAQLADLKVLLQSDPIKGFARAAAMFEASRDDRNLPGMMAVIQATENPAGECMYDAPVEDMIDTALAVATDNGAWLTVGDLHAVRTRLAVRNNNEYLTMARHLRFLHFSDAAAAAYAKAGRVPQGHPGLAEGVYEGVTTWAAGMQKNNEELRQAVLAMAPRVRQLMAATEEATANGRDSEAVALLKQLLDQVRDEPFDQGSRLVGAFAASFLWLRESEGLMPVLKTLALADDRQEPADFGQDLRYSLLLGCTQGWNGGRDASHEMLDWCWDQVAQCEIGSYQHVAPLVTKMRRMRQDAEADRWLQSLLDRTLARPNWRGADHLLNATTPQMDPGLRRMLLRKHFDQLLRELPGNVPSHELAAYYWMSIQHADPPEGTQWWGTWMADAILGVAAQVPQLEATVHLTAEAGRLYELAGRQDLALGAAAQAKQLAARAPGALTKLALAQAQWLARDGKWEEVVKRLADTTAETTASSDLVGALMLLAEAQQRLGHQAAAQAAVARAAQLLPRVQLPAGTRASAYLNVATFSTDPALRLSCLQAGRAAAETCGLPLLLDRFDQQLALLTLTHGDLDAAQTALLQQVNRLEERRDQLAFDPLLRQQWFSENLDPYRRLLEVATARGNAPLALWVGEKMRARALSDQMAWQKIDMGVSLTLTERETLAALRDARAHVHAQLQRLTGPVSFAGRDLRGAYIPVREALIESAPVGETEIKQLRREIDDLAQKEAAAASAIRESVPAYAAAASPAVLTGTRLLEEVGKQPGLAVLQYTLTDAGLCVVAVGRGRQPQVVRLPLGRQELWTAVGQFRESIWERKPDTAEQAAKLYDLLIRPVEDSLDDARRLWIVADGALHLLPFSALLGPGNTYLGQRVAVAMAPSLNLTVSPRAPRSPGVGTVVLAAPDTGAAPPPAGARADSYAPMRGMYRPTRGGGTPSAATPAVSTVLTALASVALPGARAEGEALAAKLPQARLFTGREADRPHLLDAGGACDILHIATHGYADPDEPDFSGLLLTGQGERRYDVLTARDVYTWPLRARLVTLSACQTALGKTVDGEGLLGLTRAFIYAGARDVVCALWPVIDDTTKTLMLAFYDKLQEGLPVEEALQHAQLALSKQEVTQAPFYWAGFIAVRGPQ